MDTDDKDLPIKDVNLTLFNEDDIYYSGIPCNLFINKEKDIAVINFPGYGGGIQYYTSEKSGLLLGFDDDYAFVVGIFMDGLLNSFEPEKSDNMIRPEKCNHCGRHPEIVECSGGWSIDCDATGLYPYDDGRMWCRKGNDDNFGYHLFDTPNEALFAWNKWITNGIRPDVDEGMEE